MIQRKKNIIVEHSTQNVFVATDFWEAHKVFDELKNKTNSNLILLRRHTDVA